MDVFPAEAVQSDVIDRYEVEAVAVVGNGGDRREQSAIAVPDDSRTRFACNNGKEILLFY